MKRIHRSLLLLSLLAGLFTSCKKDLTQTVLKQPSGITGFSANSSQFVFSQTNDSVTAVTFKWQMPNYNFTAASTFTLLIDQPSDTSGATAWANAIKVTISPDSLQKSYLGTDFNHILNILGLPFGSASNLVVRLKADVNQSTGTASTVPTMFSDLSLTVTPYKIVLIYPKLYVAGDFLNPTWTQISQPGWILASVKSDGVYEGYLNFTNAGNNFKLCSQLAWTGAYYGWGGTATTLSGASSAGNCYSPGPIYCKVTADVNALTINYVTTKWYVSGDFNAWSVTATPMTFSPTTNQWTATGVSLTAGTNLKFLGDPNWTTNFGIDSKGNLAYGAGNIPATKTGTFTITLDLSGGAGNYTYSIK
ncbi:MAG TPA: SusE domain-containing protein [Chitinophagaceae bacterium]|jgi:hypothetical protein